MNEEIKSFEFEVKISGENENFVWEGYVAAFDNVDSYGDVIEKGAFLDDIGKTIPACLEHGIPVGKMVLVKEDSRGLFVRGRLMPDQIQDPRVGSLGDRLRWFMNSDGGAGAIKYKMSIGYYPLEYTYAKRDGEDVRILTKIKMVEGSLVINAANEEAVITAYKGAPLDIDAMALLDARALEDALRKGAPMSKALAKKVVSAIKSIDTEKNNANISIEDGELSQILSKIKQMTA